MQLIFVQLQQKDHQHEECIEHNEREHGLVPQIFQISRNSILIRCCCASARPGSSHDVDGGMRGGLVGEKRETKLVGVMERTGSAVDQKRGSFI